MDLLELLGWDARLAILSLNGQLSRVLCPRRSGRYPCRPVEAVTGQA